MIPLIFIVLKDSIVRNGKNYHTFRSYNKAHLRYGILLSLSSINESANSPAVFCAQLKNRGERQSWSEGKNGTSVWNSRASPKILTQPLRKGYYIWLKPVLLLSDFLKIEKAWNIFLKRASKKRVSSKYVYGEFRKTGVRKIGVKIFLQCLHKSKGA